METAFSALHCSPFTQISFTGNGSRRGVCDHKRPQAACRSPRWGPSTLTPSPPFAHLCGRAGGVFHLSPPHSPEASESLNKLSALRQREAAHGARSERPRVSGRGDTSSWRGQALSSGGGRGSGKAPSKPAWPSPAGAASLPPRGRTRSCPCLVRKGSPSGSPRTRKNTLTSASKHPNPKPRRLSGIPNTPTTPGRQVTLPSALS